MDRDIEPAKSDISARSGEIKSSNSSGCFTTAEINIRSGKIQPCKPSYTLSTQIAEKDASISTLQSEIEAKDATISALQSQIQTPQQQLEIQILGVYLSPNGGCENQIIHWINQANVSIHVLIYSFTSDPICVALINAHNRGVEVEVVFDEGRADESGGEYQNLKDAGIDVRNNNESGYMHNVKVAL